MVLGIPPHSHSYFPLSRSLILIPLPFTPLTLIPLYYAQARHSSVAALGPGLLIAHPNSIYLVFACFGLTNEKTISASENDVFFCLVSRQTSPKKGNDLGVIFPPPRNLSMSSTLPIHTTPFVFVCIVTSPPAQMTSREDRRSARAAMLTNVQQSLDTKVPSFLCVVCPACPRPSTLPSHAFYVFHP